MPCFPFQDYSPCVYLYDLEFRDPMYKFSGEYWEKVLDWEKVINA